MKPKGNYDDIYMKKEQSKETETVGEIQGNSLVDAKNMNFKA